MQPLRTFAHRLTVIVYFAIVVLPVVLLGFDGPWLGKGVFPARQRAEFPARMGPWAFQQIDKWFADRLGLRYPLIYLGTEFHLDAFGRPLDRHIFFGRDNWMFWTDDADRVPSTMTDSRGALRFTPAEIKRIELELLALRDQFAACKIPFAVVVAPNKQSIYREFVMDGDGSSPSRFDRLLAALSPAARAVIVDTRDTIRPAKATHAPIKLYNKTETHWNELGGFYAYVAIMDALRRAMPIAHSELTSIAQYNVSVQPYAGGDMASFVLFSPWRFPDEDVSLQRKTGPRFMPEQQINLNSFIARNPDGRGKLLLIGDSFTHGPVRYMQQHFAEIHRVINTTIAGDLVVRHKPDAVLRLLVERNLEQLLVPQIKGAKMCPAPAGN
jgi:alginate O-acetyltransferase complex protein AlgJ